VLAWFIDLWHQSVQASGGSSGCPVADVAIDAGTTADHLNDAARGAFSSWRQGRRLCRPLQLTAPRSARPGPIMPLDAANLGSSPGPGVQG